MAQQQPNDTQQYYAVIVDSQEPDVMVRSAATEEELIKLLRLYYGRPVCVFPFFGKQLHISKGPTVRYLINGDTATPLIETEDPHDIDPSGSLHIALG